MTVTSHNDHQQLLSQAIGPACHELRSPLAVVYGFAKMLDADTTLNDKQRQFAGHILRGSERLDVMLDLLARLDRVAAGRATPALEHVELSALLADAAASAQPAGRMTVDDGAAATVLADPAWLREAVVHIVEALSFEEGIDVHVSWVVESGDVTISVIPNSSFPVAGVEPDRAGLGVALARLQVVAMGGSLDGRGDRITMTIPRA